MSFQFLYCSSSQCVVVLPLFRLALCTRLFGKRRRDGTIEFSVLCFLQKRFLIYCITFPDIFFLSFTPLSWRLLLVNIPLISKLIITPLVNKMYSCDIMLMMSNFRGRWVIPKNIISGLMRVVSGSAARCGAGTLPTRFHRQVLNPQY